MPGRFANLSFIRLCRRAGFGFWRHSPGRWFAVGVFLACCAGALQIWRFDGPILKQDGERAGLGILRSFEPTENGVRLYINLDLPEGQIPLRLTYKGKETLNIGGRYQVVFWAAPQDTLIYPGAYDGAYGLWFRGPWGGGCK